MGLLDPYDAYGNGASSLYDNQAGDPGGGGAVPAPATTTPNSIYGSGITGAFVPPVATTGKVGNGAGAAPGFDLTGRPIINLPGVPKFSGPQFSAPSFADAQNDPGYQFALKAGQDALQRSAAAGGILRTGGTLKDLSNYSEAAAGQQYGNVFNRGYQAWQAAYQGAKDAFAPQLVQYQTRAAAEQAAALAQYARQFDVYALDHHPGGGSRQPALPPTYEQFTQGGF